MTLMTTLFTKEGRYHINTPLSKASQAKNLFVYSRLSHTLCPIIQLYTHIYHVTFCTQIPIFQRGGTIVAMKQRVRRSSVAMDDDPYTLIIALDRDVSYHIFRVTRHYLYHVHCSSRVMQWERSTLMMGTRMTTNLENSFSDVLPSQPTH